MNNDFVEKREISGEIIAEVSVHGGMLYMTIPKRLAEFQDIRIGDIIRLQFLELQRHKGEKPKSPKSSK